MNTMSMAAETVEQIEALWRDGCSVAAIRKKVIEGRALDASVLAYVEGYLAAVLRRGIE